MLANFILITYRNLVKNKLFILINIFGMGVAIAQCITGYFAYRYDTTFNAQHRNGETVYRVSSLREFNGQVTRYDRSSLPLGDIVAKTFPDVSHSSRFTGSYSNFKINSDLFPANLRYVDPDFFDLFTFDFLAGGASNFDKTGVLLSRELAVRLFGNVQSAFGKTLTQVYGETLKEVKVTGVYEDPPMNSSFYSNGGSSYMNFENAHEEHPGLKEGNWAAMVNLFVQIPDPGRVEGVQAQLQPFRENNNKAREDFFVKAFVLDRFSTMAHVDRAEDVGTSTWGAPPISAVIGSNVMGILVLLLACFNLTNTSIAISSRRLKEMGIRKVMGSTRRILIVQHISETMVVCLLAVLLGLLLSDFMVRGWNYMWKYFILTPSYLDMTFIAFLIGVLVFAGLAAGSYPAFYISKFNPVTILKNKLQFQGTNYFTRILLMLQLAISLISIVSAIGFLQNAAFQRDYDLGFDVRGSMIAWVNSGNEFETYRNALKEDDHIASIAGARSGIFSNRANDPVAHESREMDVDIIEVGDQYVATLGLTLIAGRNFITDSETDRKESVIITRKIADEFGWNDAIGKQLIWRDSVKLYVVGVVKDVYTTGLWRELRPMMIRFVLPSGYNQLVVKARSEDDVAEINSLMSREWSNLFPNRLYNGQRLDDNLLQVDEVNTNIVYMFGFMGLVTLLLSATGLFALVSLNIIKRRKEIAVRRVLGASIGTVMRLMNTEFMLMLILASILGSWAGYFQSSMIMGSIWRYFQAPNALTFGISIAALLVVSLLATGYKAYKAAAANPVDSLKSE